jgi:hypothetical protein
MPSTSRFHPILPDLVLLAMGLGRRLLSLAGRRPKPLPEVGGIGFGGKLA